MQVNKTSTSSHPRALNHQIEGREALTDRRHKGQHGQLGLQHVLLAAAEAGESQIGEAAALGKGQPEAASQAHHPLGKHHTEQQPQRRQLQNAEREV